MTAGVVASVPRTRPVGRTLTLLRLMSRPARQGRAAIALPAVAFTVTTALLLTVVGGATMFLTDPRADSAGGLYGILAILALLLLSVPLFTLGAAAARLSSRRRDDRLATLRLLGASTGEIWTLTVVEATGVAAAGAVGGVALAIVLLPAVGLLPFFGGPVGVMAVAPHPWAVVAVAAAVIVVAAASAVTSLRRVQVTPLGVARRADAPPTRRRLIVVGLLAMTIIAGIVANFSALAPLVAPALAPVLLAALFAGGMALLNLVGTPIVAARGRALARRANSAAALIAGRELAGHAAAAWRRVSGMALVSFIAVVAGSGLALVDGAGSTGVDPVVADIRTGVLLTLAIAFVLLACTVGVTQAASVFEERELIVGLDRLGVPDGELRRARRIAVMVPLRWAALGGATLGAVLAAPVIGLSVIVAPLALVTIAATFAVGFALVVAAVAATRPIVDGIRRAPH